MLLFEQQFRGKRILLTGHTGFTGSWACLWLDAIGARVSGYSLPPETDPSLYQGLNLHTVVDSELGDIADYPRLKAAFDRVRPELVLHLAAQPLVRRSYREPVSTFASNALGTAHVLEAARLTPGCRAMVCVTTDKVYRNNEWPWPYRENDPLGGKDPYSASKAAAEMVIDSYRYSFGASDGNGLAIATARGGNIIGGGDWSQDRLIPDFVRAVVGNTELRLRYLDATRPWQHVLALVQGYLMLLSGLLVDPARHVRAWNLGPQDARQLSVRQVLDQMSSAWTRPNLVYEDDPLPEAGALALDSSLATNRLGWSPAWATEQMITETARWYRDYYRAPEAVNALTRGQLDAWRAILAERAGESA